MWSKIWALIEVIKALFSLWREFKGWRDRERQKELEQKQKDLERAADELSKAQTEKEFDDAQSKLIDAKLP
jgi:Sec-independent protein translocase protein TatA